MIARRGLVWIVRLISAATLLGWGTHAVGSAAARPFAQTAGETLIVPFARGPYAVTTQNDYAGTVTLKISGIGQASGTSYTDAFYLLTDPAGRPVTPSTPSGWIFSINNQLASQYVVGGQVPAYRGDHTYSVQINAPGGKLVLGVYDLYTPDNLGSYIVTLETGAAQAGVPFFSQQNPAWYDHPLRTSGACSAYCSILGHCGCAVTSAAMILAYYGVNTQPDNLSDCLGTRACMLDYAGVASCSGGKVSFVGRYAFSASLLHREVAQNHRPVMVGLQRPSKTGIDTHFVVVTSGQGTDLGGYVVNDPFPLNGANTTLSVLQRQGYSLVSVIVYAGTPAGQSLAPQPQSLAGPSPAALPVGETLTAVSGSLAIYHVDETAVIVQVASSSDAAAVTEMRLWTESSPTTAWQPYSGLAWLPWQPGDSVHGQFRDAQGQLSPEYVISLGPDGSPPPDPYQVFIPAMQKD